MRIKKMNEKVTAFITIMLMIMPFLSYFSGICAHAETINNSGIRILEIQPTNNFSIGDTNKDTGEFTVTSQGKKVIVEHITMAEFIAKTDKINGKYDAIVIGRRIENSNNKYNFDDYDSIDNDITNRKAEEIKDFIKSGQLVYIDSSIEHSTNTNITHTKLYKNFSKDKNEEISNFDNARWKNIEYENGFWIFIHWNQNLNVDDIVSDYSKIQNKRYKIDVTEYPKGDNEYENGLLESRDLQYKLNISTADGRTTDNIVDVKLYLDINGDGLYKNKERVDSHNSLSLPIEGVQLSYNLSKDFLGYLSWKIEVTDSNGVKSYVTSSFKINKLEGTEKIIRVLQVMQESNNKSMSSEGKDGVLNLQYNTEFNKKLNEVKERYGYNIKIDSIGANEFYGKKYPDVIKVNNKEKQLNGDYDMLIIGFGDWYNTSLLSKKALDEIEQFAETNQGIMFTHDTTYYKDRKIADVNPYGVDSSDDDYKRYNTTQKFADIIGQSRYNNEHNIKGADFIGKTIPHDPDKPNGTEQKAMGSTIRKRDNIAVGNATNVYKTNEATITNYPYTISQNMSVRKTHTQYLQLNLEDEDVVPWLNLSSSDVNKYDARNSYYTYSKGNITFSGTGENKRDVNEYPESEMELFINTIVKAERGANHAPIIDSTIPKEGSTNNGAEIGSDKDYIFKVKATDMDNDNVKIAVSVEVDGKWQIINEKSKNTYIKQGEYLNPDAVISKDYFKDNEILNIKVEATDEQGATATKEYKLVPTPNPQLSYKFQEGKGLVGEEISTKVNLSKSNLNKNQDIKIKNISVGNYNKLTFSNIKLSSIDDINNSLTINLKTTTISESNEYLPIKLEYQVCKTDGEIGSGDVYKPKIEEIKVPISSKKGQVNLEITNDDNTAIQPNVTLKKNDNKISTVNVGSMSYTWPDKSIKNILSGKYNVEINNLKDMDATIVSETGQNEVLSYDKPVANIEIKLSTGKNGDVISYGFVNIKSEKYNVYNNGTPNAIKGMYYRLGTDVKVNKNNSILEVTAPNTVNIENNKVELYEVDINTKMIKSVSKGETVSTKDNIIKASNLCKGKHYLLSYVTKVESNYELSSKLINQDSEKKLNIVLQKSSDKGGELPELF